MHAFVLLFCHRTSIKTWTSKVDVILGMIVKVSRGFSAILQNCEAYFLLCVDRRLDGALRDVVEATLN